MELKWAILLVPIAVAVGVLVWFAVRRSRHSWQGELPYLARSFRLTQLPEYQRAVRRHEWLSIGALVLVALVVAALLIATTRPTKTYTPQLQGSDTPHVDIMLCFDPMFDMDQATENGLAPLMSDLANTVREFGNQRVGLTNGAYRAFPMTSDAGWAARRLDEIATAAQESADEGAFGSSMPDDYMFDHFSSLGLSPADTIAMCATGFPDVGTDNGRGRAIVYIGATKNYDSDPGIYSVDEVAKVITTAGVQLNALVPGQIWDAQIAQLVRSSGGRQLLYTEVSDSLSADPIPEHIENQKDELSGAVDTILGNPPPSPLDEAQRESLRPFQWDVPDLLLQIALVAALALAACRVGMRL